jgi:hypothetical protein
MTEATAMTEDAFIEHFKPEEHEDGSIYVQRYHDSRELIEKAIKERKLWTMVEADEEWYLLPDYHLVNRLYYVICQVPFTEEQENMEVHCE